MDYMRMFEAQMLECLKCRTERVRLSFDELPLEQQNTFKKDNHDVKYYRYCPDCNEYMMIWKVF